jgi:hypothetical protein
MVAMVKRLDAGSFFFLPQLSSPISLALFFKVCRNRFSCHGQSVAELATSRMYHLALYQWSATTGFVGREVLPWLRGTGHSYSDVQRVKTICRNEQFCTAHATEGTIAFTLARFGARKTRSPWAGMSSCRRGWYAKGEKYEKTDDDLFCSGFVDLWSGCGSGEHAE